MKFVADESVDFQIVSRLRSDGHEVLYIAETLSGASDSSVLAQANRQRAVLLTSDKDFSDLVFRQRLISSGILLLRIAGLSKKSRQRLWQRPLASMVPQCRDIHCPDLNDPSYPAHGLLMVGIGS